MPGHGMGGKPFIGVLGGNDVRFGGGAPNPAQDECGMLKWYFWLVADCDVLFRERGSSEFCY